MVDQNVYSESKIQQIAITEVRNRYPATYGLLFHVPNGGLRDPRTASILTGQGVVPGIQDLFFLWAGKFYLIEVKDAKGQVSPAQKVIHAQHKLHGIDTYVFRTSEQIIDFVGHIVLGQDIGAFTFFISPYSNAERLQQYKEEYREYRMKGKGKKLVC